MIIELYISLLIVTILMILYSFRIDDKEYFSNLLGMLMATILLFTLSYTTFIGIETRNVINIVTYNSSVIESVTSSTQYTSYSYTPIAILLLTGGIIMLLCSVLKILDITNNVIKE